MTTTSTTYKQMNINERINIKSWEKTRSNGWAYYLVEQTELGGYRHFVAWLEEPATPRDYYPIY